MALEFSVGKFGSLDNIMQVDFKKEKLVVSKDGEIRIKNRGGIWSRFKSVFYKPKNERIKTVFNAVLEKVASVKNLEDTGYSLEDVDAKLIHLLEKRARRVKAHDNAMEEDLAARLSATMETIRAATKSEIVSQDWFLSELQADEEPTSSQAPRAQVEVEGEPSAPIAGEVSPPPPMGAPPPPPMGAPPPPPPMGAPPPPPPPPTAAKPLTPEEKAKLAKEAQTKKIDDATAKLNELKQEMAQLEKDRGEAGAKRKELDPQVRELEKNKEKIAEYQRENARLEQLKKQEEQRKTSIAQLEKLIAASEVVYGGKEISGEQLQKLKKDAELKLDALNTNAQKNLDAIREQETKVAGLQSFAQTAAEYAELNRQLKEAVKANFAAQDKIKEKREEITKQEEKIANLKGQKVSTRAVKPTPADVQGAVLAELKAKAKGVSLDELLNEGFDTKKSLESAE